ncbi:MAG: Inosine/xanthosine triphosphate pyrophosphatase all-alpha NTP-PPase family [Candidatus Methanohalarchaeum thermophilum]|uniref:Inosine/xanthosine triphosphate pyrophosphatase all-alpha NTP-PPase family n=1 Tax=Methanohalarchaeum thermophilum TaxID=1903181 RepID=A0A1Q6DV19_METT1|nr:MAG: Inosine/xanthosine triphosphate pyrophosphatase all-alpha NTP-PPase family [Candidatus Methanohalarchaeum thermophilum]
MSIEIKFATGNIEKSKEVNSYFEEIRFERIDVPYPEVQGRLEEVASYGVDYVYDEIKEPVIVEDSGLLISGLNGFPGPYSSFVFETLGNSGIIKLLEDKKTRESIFKTVIGYKDNERKKIFEGKIEGEIAEKPRGDNGFGYDPIFKPKNSEKTFGEMKRENKNEISHRRRAFSELSSWLNSKDI